MPQVAEKLAARWQPLEPIPSALPAGAAAAP